MSEEIIIGPNPCWSCGGEYGMHHHCEKVTDKRISDLESQLAAEREKVKAMEAILNGIEEGFTGRKHAGHVAVDAWEKWMDLKTKGKG